MIRALGITVHTGWAACVVAAGTLRRPSLAAREHLELLPDPERFVFHRAAEMPRAAAARFVERARTEVVSRASRVLERLVERHDARMCAVVAKSGVMPDLDRILESHPRIHAAEGLFYRDAVAQAAEAQGLRVSVIDPTAFDLKAPDLLEAGRLVGKPWDRDWKLASLAGWAALATPSPD
jgi:hypothetical protein